MIRKGCEWETKLNFERKGRDIKEKRENIQLALSDILVITFLS